MKRTIQKTISQMLPPYRSSLDARVFSAKGAMSKQPGAAPQDSDWILNKR